MLNDESGVDGGGLRREAVVETWSKWPDDDLTEDVWQWCIFHWQGDYLLDVCLFTWESRVQDCHKHSVEGRWSARLCLCSRWSAFSLSSWKAVAYLSAETRRCQTAKLLETNSWAIWRTQIKAYSLPSCLSLSHADSLTINRGTLYYLLITSYCSIT